jgi:hypothetical protein
MYSYFVELGKETNKTSNDLLAVNLVYENQCGTCQDVVDICVLLYYQELGLGVGEDLSRRKKRL